MREVEKAGILFADDFVGVSDSKEKLQKLIDVVHSYCNKWRLKANVSKSAVMVFARNKVEGDGCGESINFLGCVAIAT